MRERRAVLFFRNPAKMPQYSPYSPAGRLSVNWLLVAAKAGDLEF
jgi:hypothetical protein